MKIKLTKDSFEDLAESILFLYMLRPGPELWRNINRYRSAMVRVRSYEIRRRSVSKVWKLRSSMQPWLKKLLSPYYLFYYQN